MVLVFMNALFDLTTAAVPILSFASHRLEEF